MGTLTDGPDQRNASVQVDPVATRVMAIQCDPETLLAAMEDFYEDIDGDEDQFFRATTTAAMTTANRGRGGGDVRSIEAELIEERERLREIYESEIQAVLNKISEQLDRTKTDKGDIERQLGEILGELQRYKTDNLTLSTRYEKSFEGIHEQINLIKVKNN